MTAPPRPPAQKRGRPRKKLGPRGTEYRRVFTVGNSLAVTLTPGCARLLGVERGGTVQVMPHVSGKVIIAPVGMKIGARRELVNAAREVVFLRGQLVKLKRKLYALPKRQVAQGFSVGYTKALRVERAVLLEEMKATRETGQALFALLTAAGKRFTDSERP